MNSVSYYFHYRNIDSTRSYALRALSLADDYDDGKAESFNNLAFVSIARMQYKQAYAFLDSALDCTDNQVERLVSNIQLMRLCQRESRNKEFYDYYEKASQALARINEEEDFLSEHLCRRMIYARSEFAITTSTYYYYVGLEKPSREALDIIEPNGEIRKDTAQYINYLYQIGSGGILNNVTPDEKIQKEWESLIKCYYLAKQSGNIYWEANSLQAMSEHLNNRKVFDFLITGNQLMLKYVNPDNMPDSLIAGYLAQKSLGLFREYGDVYQIAGSYRTLASCYWEIGDYNSAMICLEHALYENEAINQAPDLIASIRERLSLTYSAMDDKPNSDYNRNLYLDMQDQTRQDRQLEARAEQLDHSLYILNIMILAVVLMIVIVALSLLFFAYLRRRRDSKTPLSQLLVPLQKWQNENTLRINSLSEKYEEINEAHAINEIHITNNKRKFIENQAKIFLVNSVMPFIDRMIHEVSRLVFLSESESIRKERYAYITELTDKINDYNNVLTQWIQLQQGQLSLSIESFRLQELFDIVAKGRMSFTLKKLNLVVKPTEDIVKADRTLTLFMINTIADNARKFTPAGGTVTISSDSCDDYVEISIEDNGTGIDKEELAVIFNHKVLGGHGFGLMNCKGIIEKYRKISKVFSVCFIGAESVKGEGSRFFFRLPKGLLRILILFSTLASSLIPLDIYSKSENQTDKYFMTEAGRFADSAYYSNIDGTYIKTIHFADSARKYLNEYYVSHYPEGKELMTLSDEGGEPAELIWFRKKFPVDYDIILDIRNESAVAALALHDWDLYRYNNAVYTQLYKETSADRMLGEYVKIMQRSESNKSIAIILLLLLLAMIVVAYYLLYYRHRLYFRFCVEKIDSINSTLIGSKPDELKLKCLDKECSVLNFPPPLEKIVVQIREALETSIKINKERCLDIELAEDELRRVEYENQKFHVCNNVLDNCLSTLKHETMYYPSRIRQLLDETDRSLPAIHELLLYYKQLYSILSNQAMRQLDMVNNECQVMDIREIRTLKKGSEKPGIKILGDPVLVSYLFDILQKQNGAEYFDMEITEKDNKYIIFKIEMPSMAYRDLFTPSMSNIPFLICRQIVRTNSETTNLRGCGIVAEQCTGGGTVISVTLAKGNKNENKNR